MTEDAVVTMPPPPAETAARQPAAPAWQEVERELAARGWGLSARLLWVVEARRGQDFEQGLGASRDEAYAQLRELARLDEGPRVP